MVSSARPVRAVTAVLVVVVGVAAVVDLAGGPSLGRWQAPLFGFVTAAWWVVFIGRDRRGDAGERRLFWIGTLAAFLYGLIGLAEALA